MNNTHKLSILCLLLILVGFSPLCARQPVKRKPIDSSWKTEVDALSKRVDALESRKDFPPTDCTPALTSLQAEVARLRDALQELKNQKQTTPAGNYAQQSDLNDTQELQRIMIVHGNNGYGLIPLHSAIKEGDFDAVSRLIAMGVDVNAIIPSFRLMGRMANGVTALSMAAIYNQFDIAKFLLESGAQVNFAAHEDGEYALRYASEFSSGDLVSLFIAAGAKLDRIKPLKEESNGYSIGANSAKSPLHIAAQKGNYEAVVALIMGGAQIDGKFFWNGTIQNERMETPLDEAAKSLKYEDNELNLELVKFLVKHGATRNSRVYFDTANYSPIKCPVISGYLKSVHR